MKLLNEIERVPIATAYGQMVEGVVRVRGVDVKSGRMQRPGATWLGAHDIVRREPVAVVVRDAGGERTIRIPAAQPRDTRWLMAMVPVLAWVVTRRLKRGG